MGLYSAIQVMTMLRLLTTTLYSCIYLGSVSNTFKTTRRNGVRTVSIFHIDVFGNLKGKKEEKHFIHLLPSWLMMHSSMFSLSLADVVKPALYLSNGFSLSVADVVKPALYLSTGAPCPLLM